jgi:hypothetical protein
MGVGGGVVPVLSTRHVVEEERGSPARKAVAGVARKQDAKHMHTRVVVVTQLQQAEGVLQKIREMYGPEMMWVRVREERIKPDFPLEIQVKEGNDAHDYLDSPLCWIEVGLHRSHEERDERFLTQLGWEFKIINSFSGALLGADLESSLENQQRFWKILEYRVIDEESCTWVAKARRVYSLDGLEEEEARVRVLLVRGFQSLVLDESVAKTLFRS